ncbi:AbrB/MazE/SpoVT family DNA-binding domain-containing protein [Thiosulfativibrio zosterae]|uniref:SpoVT-AbrB domain-containing protein n=1 Tax=Thiosulfativibrio zosterae TaxID=2675053 RepID=A0A6F8PR28_9GAMM|nr:AbrB family transcriptional regulator [Thiosulfativibrio zosterae]BBP44583.1 hypothetical protein THMIRHAT_23290 [Thiosulfativibrio zosterae]
MQATIRKIGNSKGIIIPIALLNQLQIESEVELTVQDNCLLIQPVATPRKGWFDGYDVTQDDEPLAKMSDLPSEEEDWVW